MMKDFRTLAVWQKSHQLTLSVYAVTKDFPRDEQFGLTSQIRRASSSVPANIAEGCGRASDAEFGRFLQIAFGSVNELDYHLLLARDLSLMSGDRYKTLYENLIEVKRMLASLIRKVQGDR